MIQLLVNMSPFIIQNAASSSDVIIEQSEINSTLNVHWHILAPNFAKCVVPIFQHAKSLFKAHTDRVPRFYPVLLSM